MKRISPIFLITILALFFTSCSPQYIKVAKNFVRTGDSLAVIIYPPNENIIYKKINTDDIPGYDTMSAVNKTKAEIINSKFLKEITLEEVYNLFVNEYINYLSESNIQVYTPEYEKEFYQNKKTISLQISQLQLEEYIEKETDEQVIDTIIYYNDVYLDAFAISVWIDIMLDSTTTPKVLFASDNITDYHNGRFYLDTFTNEILYKEDKMKMSPDDIKYFIKMMAQKYANYTFDYILNDYIDKTISSDVEQMPKGIKIHVDLDNNYMYYYEEDEWGFEEMK